MSCCKKTDHPRLAYGLVSCSPEWFDNPEDRLKLLEEHDFCVVSLVPEYPVLASPQKPDKLPDTDNGYPKITNVEILKPTRTTASGTQEPDPDYRYTPSPDKIKDFLSTAMTKKMCVQITPHIDTIWRAADAGSPKHWRGWRAHLPFDPMGEYKTAVIDPLLDAIKAVLDAFPADADCKPCISFSLGAELDMSVMRYPDKWRELCEHAKSKLQSHAECIEFSHKFNHDFWTSFDGRFAALNGHYLSGNGNKAAIKCAVAKYTTCLDVVSVSFYPNLGKADEWKKPPSTDQSKALAGVIGKEFRRVKKEMTDNIRAGLGACSPPVAAPAKLPCIEIGESGIGWTDPERPWQDIPKKQPDPIPQGADPNKIWMPDFEKIAEGIDDYRKIRCNYFSALLYYLWHSAEDFSSENCKTGCMGSMRTVALWSNHWQFDVLGWILDLEPAEKREKIREHFIDEPVDGGDNEKKIARLLKLYNAGNLSGDVPFTEAEKKRIGCTWFLSKLLNFLERDYDFVTQTTLTSPASLIPAPTRHGLSIPFDPENTAETYESENG